jgi:hypothetical protein
MVGPPPVAPVDLRTGDRGANACAYLRLGAQAAEKAFLRVLHDLDLGILLVDAQLIEGHLGGLLDRAGGRDDPFHDLLPLLLLA